jgi:hypothetical protein
MKTIEISEYDAFGPWIYIIKNRNSIPPLFRNYEEQLSGSLMSFKVPRDMERRDANPRMNLYDAVVAIFTDKILFLERINQYGTDTVQKSSIPMSEIDSIKRWTCLLKGTLTICIADKPVVIPYNTVSDNLIREAVNLIRSMLPQKSAGKSELKQIPAITHSLDFMEHGFVSICDRTLREIPDLRLITYQPYLYYRIPRQFNLRILMKLGLMDTIKSAFVIFLNERELVIVRRTYNYRFPSTEAYAYSEIIIPINSLKHLKAARDNDNQLQLVLETPVTSEKLLYDKNNSSIGQMLEIFKSAGALEVQAE